METSAFESHAAWASSDALKAALDDAVERGDAAVVPQIERLRYLASAVNSHKETPDAAPYSQASLDAVNASLSNVVQEVRNYVSNGNSGHLTNAEKHEDGALQQLGSWPQAGLRGGAATQAAKVFKEYREGAEDAIQALAASNAELRETETALRQKLSDIQGQLDALSAKITQDETRLDASLTSHSEAFTSKQTEREERFKEFLEEQGAALDAMAEKDLASIEKKAEQANASLAAIDALRHSTEKVAGLATADILSGEFAKHSKARWWSGIVFSIVGFLALAGGVALLVLTLRGLSPDESMTWQFAAMKLGATATIVGASAVAFRLGARFIAESSTSKRMELELRAIGPFFADVDDPAVVVDVKRAWVERAFAAGARSSEGDQPTGQEMLGVVGQALDVIRASTSRGS